MPFFDRELNGVGEMGGVERSGLEGMKWFGLKQIAAITFLEDCNIFSVHYISSHIFIG